MKKFILVTLIKTGMGHKETMTVCPSIYNEQQLKMAISDAVGYVQDNSDTVEVPQVDWSQFKKGKVTCGPETYVITKVHGS